MQMTGDYLIILEYDLICPTILFTEIFIKSDTEITKFINNTIGESDD